MKLKLDDNGNAVLQDGKPVYVHDDGKEIAFDALQAGKLRHRLKFYQSTPIRSATGALKTQKWEHVRTLWGQFSPLSAKEIMANQAVNNQITARVKIRHRTDITADMRIEHIGKMYEIVGEPLADNETGRQWLTLLVKGIQ